MVTYLLDFHENITFSKTLSEYQEQPYRLLYFLIHLKKMYVTFVEYSWNNQEIFLYSIFPEHYLGLFPGISYGTFSEYSGNISWECSTNIPRILFGNIPRNFHEELFLNILGIYHGNVPRIFHEYYLGIFPGIFMRNFFGIFWEYIMGMFYEYSTNIYLPGR